MVETDSVHVLNVEYIYNGAGVGLFDLNNDGLQDLVFTTNQVAPRIYLNEGEFRFKDISDRFEDLDNGQRYSGVTFTDINRDGWKDLYFTCTAYEHLERNRNRFYVCQGMDEEGVPDNVEQGQCPGILFSGKITSLFKPSSKSEVKPTWVRIIMCIIIHCYNYALSATIINFPVFLSTNLQ